MSQWPPAGRTSPLQGQVTIDSTKGAGSEEALLHAQDANPQAGQHGDDAEACRNLTGGSRDKVIVGHGYVGLLVAGTGVVIGSDSKYFALSNEGVWKDNLLAAVAGCSSLSLYGCDIAATSDGVKLLTELNKIIKKPIWAPTGALNVDEDGTFSLEEGTQWIVVGTAAASKPAKAVHPAAKAKKPKLIVPFATHPTGRSWNDVSRVVVRGRTMHASQSPYSIELNGPAAADYVRRLLRSGPVTFKGEPFAVVTATLDVTFVDHDNAQYEVLNDRLLRNVHVRDTYFRVAPPLGHIMVE